MRFLCSLCLAALSALTVSCYRSHGIDRDSDAGIARPDAGHPTTCEIDVELCSPVGEPLQLFDAQSQTPEIVWGPDRLLLTFWATESSPVLQHLDLEGRILEEIALTRGYNETHLTWNPRTGTGLLSGESALTWVGADGRPLEDAWVAPDARFRGTLDVGPTDDGFAVVVGRTGIETQVGIATTPGDIVWQGIGVSSGEPAVADRWDGGVWALTGGFLVRHDGTSWSAPVELVVGSSFAPLDVLELAASLYTLHYHYDGRHMVRRWTRGAVLEREALVGVPDGDGDSRIFAVGDRLFVVSTRFAVDKPIVLAEVDPESLDTRELHQIAAPVVGSYNRHSITVTETPRGLAFVWTEGAVGSGNMRPWLRLFECCAPD